MCECIVYTLLDSPMGRVNPSRLGAGCKHMCACTISLACLSLLVPVKDAQVLNFCQSMDSNLMDRCFYNGC